MKIKELLLLSLGLVVAGSAMGQTKVGDRANHDAGKYPTKIDASTHGADGYYYVPLGKDGDDEQYNTVYQTIGGEMPYYVAPSYLIQQAKYDKWADPTTPTKKNMQEFYAEFGGGHEFNWVRDAGLGGTFTAGVVKDGTMENKATVTVPDGTTGTPAATPGQFDYVKVSEQLTGAFADCGDFSTIFKVVAVAEPSLWINGTTDGSGLTAEPHAYEQEVSVDGDPIVGEGEYVLLYRSCKQTKLNSIVLNMTFGAFEQGTPNKGAKYAFSVSKVTGKLDLTNNYAWAGPASGTATGFGHEAISSGHNTMLAIADAGVAPKVSGSEEVEGTKQRFDPASNPEAKYYYDVIYYLDNAIDVKPATGTLKRGVVSPVSMLSYRGAADFTEGKFDGDFTGSIFPFAKGAVAPAASNDKYRAVVLRLQLPPATGPVYHIPLDLF